MLGSQQAARSALELSHNLRSEVETLHINATVEWKEVVSAARRSDVIFNCIDHGNRQERLHAFCNDDAFISDPFFVLLLLGRVYL